jgi:hypothetical protein
VVQIGGDEAALDLQEALAQHLGGVLAIRKRLLDTLQQSLKLRVEQRPAQRIVGVGDDLAGRDQMQIGLFRIVLERLQRPHVEPRSSVEGVERGLVGRRRPDGVEPANLFQVQRQDDVLAGAVGVVREIRLGEGRKRR